MFSLILRKSFFSLSWQESHVINVTWNDFWQLTVAISKRTWKCNSHEFEDHMFHNPTSSCLSKNFIKTAIMHSLWTISQRRFILLQQQDEILRQLFWIKMITRSFLRSCSCLTSSVMYDAWSITSQRSRSHGGTWAQMPCYWKFPCLVLCDLLFINSASIMGA